LLQPYTSDQAHCWRKGRWALHLASRMSVKVPGFINMYVQGDGSQRVSPPLASRVKANEAAVRVWRATGGACVRVKVVERRVEMDRLVEVS
jgi:hypothetical protein